MSFTVLALLTAGFANAPVQPSSQISGKLKNDGKNHDILRVTSSLVFKPRRGRTSIPCGLEGRFKPAFPAADLALAKAQNQLKNRYKAPSGPFPEITTTQIAAEGADDLEFFRIAEVTGYVRQVKPGGDETCNAYATKAEETDTHIELVPTLTNARLQDTEAGRKEGKEKIMVVEVTPRVRQIVLKQGLDWSNRNLEQLERNHSFVRIRGYMFNDLHHRPQSASTHPEWVTTDPEKIHRGGVWEIHPITEIQVLVERPTN